MRIQLNQQIVDDSMMIEYICQRIPLDGCRIVLFDCSDGPAWVNLTPLWDNELGWDLRFETNYPKRVTLGQIYDHFRGESFPFSESDLYFQGTFGTGGIGESSLYSLEWKIDQILDALRQLVCKENVPSCVAESLDEATTLTKAEVSRHLKISQRTIDRLRAQGVDFGEMRIGGAIRFDAAKIQQIIATKKTKRRRP